MSGDEQLVYDFDFHVIALCERFRDLMTVVRVAYTHLVAAGIIEPADDREAT